MKKENVKSVLEIVFMHAGIVEEITMRWEKEDVCHLEVKWRPWLSIKQEDITDLMLDSGLIIDDSYRYRRYECDGTMSTENITLNLGEENWRRELAKQLSRILAQEIRAAVGKHEQHSTSVGDPK